MKSNNKLDFISKFKYLLIIPIILIVASIVLGAIFGFNRDYDYKTVYNFNVKFNTTVTEAEYKSLENELIKTISSHNIENYRIERVGEGAQNALIVKIPNDDKTLDSNISALKLDIEDNLYDAVSAKIESPVVIATTDTVINNPMSVSSYIWYSVLSIVVIMIFTFVYHIIRYNLVAGVTSVANILFECVILTAMLLCCRVPVNSGFPLAYGVMIVTGIVVSTIINNSIKNNLNNDAYAKYSNADRIYDCVNKSLIAENLIILAILLVAFAIVSIFVNISTMYTLILVYLGVAIAMATSLFFGTSLWSLAYERGKDSALKRRIANEQAKLENANKKETEEKIVV